jgi:hypothetical protein
MKDRVPSGESNETRDIMYDKLVTYFTILPI